MKERPILFSAPMVRAILEGRKTMTRRVAIHRFDERNQCEHTEAYNEKEVPVILRHCAHGSGRTPCPYGQPGDRLWVRETWWHHLSNEIEQAGFEGGTITMLDGHASSYGPVPGFMPSAYPRVWRKRPSIHMPRWASRILLEVTAVRVEQLQDINRKGAEAEGIYQVNEFQPEPYRQAFRRLWDSINAKRGYGWDANPWVWVIEFERLADEAGGKL